VIRAKGIAVPVLLLAVVASAEVHRSRGKRHTLEIRGRRYVLTADGAQVAAGELDAAPRDVFVLDGEAAALLVGKDVRRLDRGGPARFRAPVAPDVAWLEEVAAADGKLALPALFALAGMGARGAPAVARLLAHSNVPDAAKRRVARRAADLPREPFVKALVRELGRAEDDPANAGPVLDALLRTGAPDVAARVQPHERVLRQVLERGSADVGWLADYFRARPTSQAVPGLLEQLARSRRRSLDRKLMAALKACSGADFGPDKRAWLRGLQGFGR